MTFFRHSQPSKSYDDPSYHKSSPTALRLFTAISYLLSTVFLILVCIGNINNRPVIRSTYFLTIDLANVIPSSVPNAVLINTVARSIGLHDFYQVGLWNYCEGYNDQGITHCSKTKTLYWFNPVAIILSELLAGATIALPTDITNALRLVRIVSHWMFACFIVGTVLTFTCVFLAPLGFSSKPQWEHRSRRIFCREIPLMIWTFLTLIFTAGGAVIATVMFVMFRNTFTSAQEVNIEASLGKPVLAFMWTAVAFNLLGFLTQFLTCCSVCFCAGRRQEDRRRMTTPGNKAVNDNGTGDAMTDKQSDVDRRRRFWKR